MSSLIEDLSKKYYQISSKLLKLKNKTNVLIVDFKKHWTQIIFDQKKYFIIAFIFESISQAFYTLIPILVGWVIEYHDSYYFWVFISGWVLANLAEFISNYYGIIMNTQSVNSIQFNAFKYFITVDPIFHTRRESGKIFAKIERASRAYEDILLMVLWDLVPTLSGFLTVIFSFVFVDKYLGTLALISLIFIAISNIILNIFYAFTFENRLITADDEVKTINVESLTQVLLIRSCYASKDIVKKSKNATHDLITQEGTAWITFSFTNFITKFVYLISVGLISYYIIKSNVSIPVGITLILTYLRGTYEVVKVGRRIRVILRSSKRIIDLFNFINNFGWQTFPILACETDYSKKIEQAIALKYITVEAKNLNFDYNPKAKILQNHNLKLTVPKSQSNKLYGIIGPSGIGKTTLLSIFGGQLKPTTGDVSVNDVSVYEIDDMGRRKLIALQGQIASSLKGSLKSSLLLGLPEEPVYTDEELIEVLKEIGIWTIFEEKEGLETQIGEGGLNISGGQRQRFNFASLYLRAKYYKPLLILIDEPTSSLDIISERAITKMINQLAENALTLVIAHRLKTIENAIGILDFTLMYLEKDIKFFTKEELKEKSIYFKKLMESQFHVET